MKRNPDFGTLWGQFRGKILKYAAVQNIVKRGAEALMEEVYKPGGPGYVRAKSEYSGKEFKYEYIPKHIRVSQEKLSKHYGIPYEVLDKFLKENAQSEEAQFEEAQHEETQSSTNPKRQKT